MSTVNGIGTMRYDWCWEDDRTASATLWFVIFFFPISPIRREHVRVVGHGIRPSRLLDTIAAFLGAGSGFHTTIEVLGELPMSELGVIRTYFMGWVVVPLLTVIGPMAALGVCLVWLPQYGFDLQTLPEWVVAMVGWGVILWVAVIVAKILDRASGRQHVDPTVTAAEQADKSSKLRREKKRS